MARRGKIADAGQVRISQVAQRAGVSTATVSRVLNGGSQVGDDLRQRVLATVEELDYRPNLLARNLRRQRTSLIGVLVADVENPILSQMVRTIEDVAFEAGYRVLVCNTDENPDKQRAYLQALEQEHVVGVLISPSDAASPDIARLLDRGFPVVAFDRLIDDPRADGVVPDNYEAGSAATRFLIDAGHRRIASVTGPASNPAGAARAAGYRDAMMAAGLPPVAADGRFRTEGGHAATVELLAGAERPTALVVANSLMTLGALQALREAGLAVPHAVSMITIGEAPWAAFVDPPLTAMAMPTRTVASDAMNLLLARVQGDGAAVAQRLVHPFALHERSSVAPGPNPTTDG